MTTRTIARHAASLEAVTIHKSVPEPNAPKARASRHDRKQRTKKNQQLVKYASLALLIFIAALFLLLSGIIDLGPPMAEGSVVYALLGEDVAPADFILVVYDDSTPPFLRGGKSPQARGLSPALVLSHGEERPNDTGRARVLTAEFLTTPSTDRLGVEDVQVQLQDAAGNKTVVSGALVVMQGTRSPVVEAGASASEITPSLFLWDAFAVNAVFVTDIESLDLRVHDERIPVRLSINGFPFDGALDVQDTIPPSANAHEMTVWTIDENVQAIDFVTNIVDGTEVTTRFAEDYDFSVIGELNIKIILTDSAGNTTELQTRAHVALDTEPPVIHGAIERNFFMGPGISYRSGVTVTDNRDKDVPLQVDSSKVDPYAPGYYPLTYSATDESGNTSSVTVTIRILNASEEMAYEKADEVIKKIIKDDMTDRQKARAVFIWVRNNIVYGRAADTSGPLQGAYAGFLTGKGDCYTYYAVSEVLLKRAGLETVGLERVPEGRTRHYWNLVYIDDGWYHFDTCPPPLDADTLLFTESQAKWFTTRIGNSTTYTHYYEYVHRDDLPEIAP